MAWRRVVTGRRAIIGALGFGGSSVGATFIKPTWNKSSDSPKRPFLQTKNALHCEEKQLPRLKYGTCKLRDGRLLAYHEEGTGVPVFAFHGMCSCRLTWVGAKPLNEVCPGVRLIAIDRPGYGGSSPPPFGYSYTAFTKDLQELADELQVPRFCVMGHSSGGPYALAAAALLPERVAACAPVSADAPYYHPTAPPAMVEADDFRMLSRTNSMGLYGREVADIAKSMMEDNKKSDPVKASHVFQSGTDGFVCDFTLERIPWSFVVEDIALGPKLTVWVGGDDIPSISLAAPFLHEMITGSELKVVPGGNHGFVKKPENLAAILNELKRQFGA